jgi:hypothetical protein
MACMRRNIAETKLRMCQVIEQLACGCAGQAVVQMARSKVNGLEYAVKFYVSKAAFDAECAMCGCSVMLSPAASHSSCPRFVPAVLNA